jgi:hypothetical protein
MEPPAISVPADIAVGNDAGKAYATVNPGMATATDNTGIQSITGVRSDGKALTDPYPIGVTTITWTATDLYGNTAVGEQKVTVSDVEAPVIVGLSVDKSTLGPPNHEMIDVELTYSLQDNYDPASGISTQVTITSNEPENGTGDGNTESDWEIVDDHHVRLRAERSGNGDGRVYTITITATDSSGNTSSRSVTVSVSHGKRG